MLGNQPAGDHSTGPGFVGEGGPVGARNEGVDAVWPGCDLWPAVKEENVKAYVEAIREYGKAPSPAVGRISS